MTNEQASSRLPSFFRGFLFAAFTAFSLALALPLAAQTPDASQDYLVIIPHTHWEGAVFKTREEYLQIGLPHIMKALSLMQRYPQLPLRARSARLRSSFSRALP